MHDVLDHAEPLVDEAEKMSYLRGLPCVLQAGGTLLGPDNRAYLVTRQALLLAAVNKCGSRCLSRVSA